MRVLSASELLSAWERGLAQMPVQRALTLLAAACPETSVDTLAKLSIGQRDAYLLTLREWTFGTQLLSLATCPSCRERVELNFNVADIRIASNFELAEAYSLSIAEYELHFRLPNSQDLAAIDSYTDISKTRYFLLKRCLLTANQNGQAITADQLPTDIVDAVVQRMAEAEPQADVQLKLSCPSCSHQWQETFDIVSFFWNEIDAWAYRVLREVHTLALAYGWHETEILTLSPGRRQFYLEMVSK
ncbi:phage baseplate protein [Gloeocapsopsis sp. AAB1 = 1H9]|uniref:Phage baseplate protein n=1 Tax=Gloeocapsopsis dulcis AAB1 = 1H9 TaxID=1433147 RepID=A0A6N8FN84_9CHRO|nr:phage baseplate protein [Gloeocapsopsis dulcis AAB1 = 1H9]